MNPKVAIIIPTYNSEKFIHECLSSAINQDYDNLEILVIDNESVDSTVNLVKNIISQCNRNILTDSAPNLYKYTWEEPTRKGLQLMSDDVEYFMFLASDDKLDENFITNNLEIIKKSNFKIKALQSHIRNFGMKTGTQGHTYKSLEEFKKLCINTCPVNTPTVVWSVDCWKQGLMYSEPENYSGAADYWMYCNQADKNLMIYPYPGYLGYNYRWNDQQATWGMHKDYKGIDKKIQEYWRNKWF